MFPKSIPKEKKISFKNYKRAWLEYAAARLATRLCNLDLSLINPEKVRYKAIGMEMNVVESCMKLVALGATQRKG